MAALIKINNSNIINNELGPLLYAVPGYGLYRIPVEESHFSLFQNAQTVSAVQHSTYQAEGKGTKWLGRGANLHLVTRAGTSGAIPPLTLHVVMEYTGRCSPLIFNSKNKIDNIRLNCIFYVTPCRTFLRSMQVPGKTIL